MITNKLVTALFLTLLSVETLAQKSLTFSTIEGSVNADISEKVLTHAYRQLNIEIHIVHYPGNRSLHSANQGRTDGELFRIIDIESDYHNLKVVPTPINQLEAVAFTKYHSLKIDGWDSLKSYKIAIQLGVKLTDYRTRHLKRNELNTHKQLFRLLHAGRVDLIVVGLANGLKSKADGKFKNIYAISPPLEISPLYHFLHRKHWHLVSPLNEVLKSMRSRGEIRKIRETALKALLSRENQSPNYLAVKAH